MHGIFGIEKKLRDFAIFLILREVVDGCATSMSCICMLFWLGVGS